MRSAPRPGGIERLPEVAAVERDVLGYPRGDAELRWILENREGYLYRRRGAAIGFAFVGREGAYGSTRERCRRWVATADPTSGTPYLVPLSFLWDGATMLIAAPASSQTSRNPQATGKVRVGLGPTRDVVVIEGTTQTLDAHDVPSDMGDAFAAATGFDPAHANHALPVFPNPPAADAGVARSRRARRPRVHALRPLARGLTQR
jgi:hypothetical protein